MDNIGKLWSQVAAEAGCTANRAKVAVYLKGLADGGRTLEYCAKAVRLKPSSIKKYARDFMIDFPDYRPFSRLEKAGNDRPDPCFLLDVA